MKCILVLMASLAFVAMARAAPVVEEENGTYIKKDAKELTKQPKERSVANTDELKQIRDELISRLQNANDETKVHLEHQLNKITDDFLGEYTIFTEELKTLFPGRVAATYSNIGGLWERIKELRNKITGTSQEVAENIKEQAIATSGTAKEKLIAAKEKLLRKVTELKDELLMRLREMLIPNDDVPLKYAIADPVEQRILNLRGQLTDSVAMASDWHNMLTEVGQAKMLVAKAEVSRLLHKIRQTIAEWRNRRIAEAQVDDTMYVDDYVMIALLTGLKQQVGTLIEQLIVQTSELKDVSIEKKEEIIASVKDFQGELKLLTSDLNNGLRDLFESNAMPKTYGLQETMLSLRARKLV